MPWDFPSTKLCNIKIITLGREKNVLGSRPSTVVAFSRNCMFQTRLERDGQEVERHLVDRVGVGKDALEASREEAVGQGEVGVGQPFKTGSR